jgi:hypothetical protein
MPGSTFCNDNTEIITASNYNAQFKDKIASGVVKERSCLPNTGTGFSVVDPQTGVVSQGSLDDHVSSLIASWPAVPLTVDQLGSSTNIDAATNDPARTFGNNAQTLRNSIHREYCFYYKRYLWVLQDVLSKAAAGSTDQAYITKKGVAQQINSKLNQILQILQALVNSRLTTLKGYYGADSGVNALNKDLDRTREELIKHSEMLKKNDLEKDAKAAMVDYSIEKNSSSRNLLAIYGFMNIVAAGLIFYLYRSAKSE